MNEVNESKKYLDTKIGFFNKAPSVTTMYAGNLHYEMDELHIQELFEEFGVVNYVKLIKDSTTHISKGIAFVQMINPSHAKIALETLDGCEVGGRKIKVSIAVDSNKPETEVASKSKRRKPYKAYVSKKDRGIV